MDCLAATREWCERYQQYQRHKRYTTMAVPIAISLWAALSIFVLISGRVRLIRFLAEHVLDSWMATLYTTEIAIQLIIFYGVPRTLTLGIDMDIGRFVPPTCEGSQHILGSGSLPCRLKSMQEYTLKWLAGKRGEELGAFDQADFLKHLLVLGLLVVVPAIVLPPVVRWRFKDELKELEDNDKKKVYRMEKSALPIIE